MIKTRNLCKWLMIGSVTPCNRSCINEFCGIHLQRVRFGSLGPKPCLQCGIGVRGGTRLCVQCGGKRYRELKRYYDKKNNDNDKIIKTPEDYLMRFQSKDPDHLLPCGSGK